MLYCVAARTFFVIQGLRKGENGKILKEFERRSDIMLKVLALKTGTVRYTLTSYDSKG